MKVFSPRNINDTLASARAKREEEVLQEVLATPPFHNCEVLVRVKVRDVRRWFTDITLVATFPHGRVRPNLPKDTG